MVVADLAIDKDNTASVYCERDQITKVEAMFNPPAAQRTWVGLTDDERRILWKKDSDEYGDELTYAMYIEAKLKERNV
jgi:hypothetical protein